MNFFHYYNLFIILCLVFCWGGKKQKKLKEGTQTKNEKWTGKRNR